MASPRNTFAAPGDRRTDDSLAPGTPVAARHRVGSFRPERAARSGTDRGIGLPGFAGGRNGCLDALRLSDQPGDRLASFRVSVRSISRQRQLRSSKRSPCGFRPEHCWFQTLTQASTTSATTASSRTFSRAKISGKGRQCFFVGGGPSLSSGSRMRSLTRWRPGVWWHRGGGPPDRAERRFADGRSGLFQLQSARGRLLGVAATDRAGRDAGQFHHRAGTQPDRSPGNQPRQSRAAKPAAGSSRSQFATGGSPAHLAEILLLEPDTLLEPDRAPFPADTLVSCDQPARDLVLLAVNNRPEMPRGETWSMRRWAPAPRRSVRSCPNLVVTSPTTTSGLLGAGNFSSGPNGQLNTATARGFDIKLAAVWQLQNGGLWQHRPDSRSAG